MRGTDSLATRRDVSSRQSARVCLAVMVALSAVACDDQQGPTAQPVAEPRSLTALEPEALRFAPDDLTVHNAWTTRSPIPRGGYAIQAGTLNGIIYVVSDNVAGARSLQAYHIATNSWSARKPLPRARSAVNGVSPLNGRLYVTGGLNSVEAPTKSVYMYNPATNTWVQKADLPTASFCGTQAVIGGQLYVYAGCTRTGRHYLWRYNAASDTWVARRAPPTVHQYPAAGVIGGKLYLAGGKLTSTGPDNLTLDVYDPATNSWVTREPMPAPQFGPASGVLNNRLYVAGGYSGGFPSNTLRVYNPAANTWTTKAPMPTARWLSAGAIAAGQMFVIGGLQNGIRNEVEAYTP